MSKLYLYLIAGAAALAALFLFIHDQRETGRQQERAKQEKADAEFKVRAQKGGVDYDTCDRAGGLYDFRRGSCKLPVAD